MSWWQREKKQEVPPEAFLRALDQITQRLEQTAGVSEVVPEEPLWRRLWLHLFLFLLTFATVTINGALLAGADLSADPWAVGAGLPFAVALMSILAVHEFGHFFAARFHGVPTTLPYFLPAPPFFIGTFGAFIRMRSTPYSRTALFDVGAAGPWAGFVASVVAFAIGLRQSRVEPVVMDGTSLELGDSLLTKALVHWMFGPIPDGFALYFSPVAFAGWVGFFVTVLNLLPIGQLDGGHIAYAFLGWRHRLWARISWLGVIACALLFWPGWYFWAIFPLALGFDHPPTRFDAIPLRGWRWWGSVMTGLLFVVLFVPRPLAPLVGDPLGQRQPVPAERPQEPVETLGLQEA